jgi:AraC family transcriptional regulator, regulatory protein of adaptative response / methylated-DNA-[protein]-cysteine methyltransferase
VNPDYVRVEKAIRFLHANYPDQPDLGRISAAVGLSEYHLQRLFRRWAGISPKRFLQYLTAAHAIELLLEARSVLEASWAAGLSGPGRLHDLLVNVEAMTPGEVKRRGEGLGISYGFHPTPFGECLLASTARGVCSLSFVAEVDRRGELHRLRQRWAAAELRHDQRATGSLVQRIFARTPSAPATPLTLLLQGTNFQIRVWEALLRIPEGRVASYSQVAESLGMPRAARAVGGAVAQNAIAYLIPCHRVIRSCGTPGDYRWGTARKHAMLGWEAARSAPGPALSGTESLPCGRSGL